MVLHDSSSSSLSSAAMSTRSFRQSSSSRSRHRNNNNSNIHNNSNNDISHGRSRSNNSSSHSNLQVDDPSSFGSMLDQLHAEQKGTIEALTCQVEFYRQREERARQELVTLRDCLPLANDDEGAVASVAKLASENRALGDELDALRAEKGSSDRGLARLERQKKELERQLRDAKHTLVGFSQAIEQLEIKMQRKEAEVQTRCLELEQRVGDLKHECGQLRQDKTTMRQQLENLQTASDENVRLHTELQLLVQQSVGRQWNQHISSSSRFSSELNSIREKFSSLDDNKRRLEAEIQELQRKLDARAVEVSTAQLEVERKNCELKELQLKLDNASNLLSLREQLLESDDSSKKEIEAQRQELLMLVSTLQCEKSDLQREVSSLRRDQETVKAELQTAKSRLATKDHTVVVSTLRSEVASLKERLRNEFMHEKDSLKSDAQSLTQEIRLLRGRLAEKDVAARNLKDEIFRKDEKQKQTEYDMRQLREQITRLECELSQSRTKYEQLQQCRTSLAEQLDVGFKELLNDEDSAASAREEVEKLRSDVSRMKKSIQALETERQTLTEKLEHTDRSNQEATTRQSEKIDELYRQLLEKEEVITSLESTQRHVALLQQEKESWEGDVTDIRLRCESRVETEVRKADGLRARIEQLEKDKMSLKQEIDTLEDTCANWKERAHVAERSLRQKVEEVGELKQDLARLESEIIDATTRVDKGKEEITTRERKLLKERKKMEREMGLLVHRIESADQRNFELGEKVIAFAQQSKVDQTDLVALSSQVKSYRKQVKGLETQLGQIHRRNGMESDTISDLQRNLGDLMCLKESYQVEINNLRQKLSHVQSDSSAAVQQRDEAVKRVRLLMQCRDDMKATAEDHTTELIEEIEALQHQMDSERKRCAVLLANEKTLLRDLQERNTVIAKLQRTISALQHRSRDKFDSDQSSSSSSSRRRRSRGSSGVGTPVGSSNESTVPTNTTSSLSPTVYRHDPPQQQQQQQQPQDPLLPSAVASSGSNETPEKEMEHLLSNLERISDFSTQMQQQQQQQLD
uniref:Uncharacterized protein n=1 Tax=Hyaloperonospora arabidopsidis (strain Emoy2) TaxID=559515 RepID=M4BW55_HYAAE